KRDRQRECCPVQDPAHLFTPFFVAAGPPGLVGSPPEVILRGARCQEDGCRITVPSSRLRRADECAGPSSPGNAISNRVLPSADTARIVPRCASTLDFVIARPSPAPSLSLVRDDSTR